MVEKFDIEKRWPELFGKLDPSQRNQVVQNLAMAWHDGWIPNREDVEDLIDLTRGAIDGEEYIRRGREEAERHRMFWVPRDPYVPIPE
ncbi:hypothetical protein [Micromonospora sp. DT31]|uniref:antitoxin VbhA family protein n=1 Tax=Micromonospora sp. DT31 TaxID=3393434 RepID=UPI003CEA5BF9